MNSLVFPIIFFCSISLLIATVAFVYGKYHERILERFLAETTHLQPVVIKSIKARFWESYHTNRTKIHLWNRSDMYLFDQYLVIIRWQSWPFKIYEMPICLLPQNAPASLWPFSYIFTTMAQKITFKQVLTKEIEFRFVYQNFMNVETEVVATFKDLTPEQKLLLEPLKSWT